MPNKPTELLRQALEALEECDAEIFSEPLATRTTTLVTAIRAHLAGAEPAQSEPLEFGSVRSLEDARNAADQARRENLRGLYPAACVVLDMQLSRLMYKAAPSPVEPAVEPVARVVGTGGGVAQFVADQREIEAAVPSPVEPVLEPLKPEFQHWPFSESPGALAGRLAFALSYFGGDMLAAVRNVFIEQGAALAAPVPPPDGADKDAMAQQIKNQLCIDGTLNKALDEILASSGVIGGPDAIFNIIASVAHETVDRAFAAAQQTQEPT